MLKLKVLLTGASGVIAGQLLPAFRERYELTLLDTRVQNRAGENVEGIQLADLCEKDRDRYRHFFKNIDAVVHCAFVGSSSIDGQEDTDARFWHELANVQMAYNIYQTALEEGIRRVVVASSNHAADYFESLILDGKHDYVQPEEKALSDNYYGWAKQAYEHLGFVFAVGKQSRASGFLDAKRLSAGRQLENVQLRIGGPRETDLEEVCALGDMRCVRRALAVYLSQRDMQQLFIKSIETEDIRDKHGVPFQIFYGISQNSHAFWSITNARKVIGYAPEDNSELKFAELIAKHIAAAKKF